MAPKRASPLDEPPTASSSSEQEVPSSDGEGEASSEEDQPPQPSSTAPHNKPPSKIPPPTLNSHQSSESISDSDSGSDSEHRWVANPRVKPVASKPMEETPKPKKAAASSSRSTTKRPTENNVSRQQNDSKRAKKRASDVTAVGEVPAKGNNGKKDEDPHFTKPRENKSLEVVDKAKSSGKARKDQKEGAKTLATLNSKEAEKMDMDKASGSMLSLSEMTRFDESLGLPGLSEDVIKRGLELIGASKRAELEERWKDLQVAELELYVKCAQLMSDQAKLIWEAYKSSNH